MYFNYFSALFGITSTNECKERKQVLVAIKYVEPIYHCSSPSLKLSVKLNVVSGLLFIFWILRLFLLKYCASITRILHPCAG